MHSIICYLFTCLHLISFSEGKIGVVTLYEHVGNNKGSSMKVLIEETQLECKNLPEDWQKRTSGINSNGICVDLYSELNCKGEKRIRVYPGTLQHHNLSNWDFDDELMSLQACDRIINDDNHELEGDAVSINDARGNILFLTVSSCKNLPLYWRNRTIGTYIYHRCYNYYSDLNCTGMNITIDVTDPDHNDFSKWNFANRTNSIDPCPRIIRNNLPTTIIDTKHLSTTAFPTAQSKENDKGWNTDTVILASVSLVAIILLLLLIGVIVAFVIYFRRRNNASPKGQTKSEYLGKKYITNFLKGNPSAFEQVSFESADAIFRAKNMAYDAEKYEIPLDKLEIDWQSPLGSGEYGMVSKAKCSSPKFPEPFDVAVKTVKAGAELGYVKALLDELKIMMYLNGTTGTTTTEHGRENVVTFIGACTQNLAKMEPYIVLELCTQGSLLHYLRKQRKSFVNLVVNGHFISIEGGKQISTSDADNDQSQIDTSTLLKWSIGVADGMEFLSSKKVIHGDLAARNVLLDDKLNVKITDFGLSRQLYQYTQYVKTQQTSLPWRWLAIESLKDMNFSTQSDVWAYGVTLYEIFSLGETPYPGIMYSPQFLSHLKDGYRMSIPMYAPNVLYNLMLKCWEEMLEERPSFSEIREELFHIQNY